MAEDKAQAQSEAAKEPGVVQKPEANMSPEFLNRFVGETYRFVTQLHLELTTLTTLLLKKGVVTVEELDENFKTVKQNFDENVARQREAERTETKKVRPEDACECAMEISAEPLIKEQAAKPRQAPQGHGG